MSYTPTNWQTGDTVTAEKLNKMESGIEDAVGSAEIATNPYIVNLTPTAQDFSGTMDKTVGEIFDAYESGRKIVFRVWISATEFLDNTVSTFYVDSSFEFPSFNAFIIIDTPIDALIYAYTGIANDPDLNTYETVVYPLTPMS